MGVTRHPLQVAERHREPTRSQRFTYDELNRIQTAQTQATTGEGKNCADLSDEEYKKFREDSPYIYSTPSGDLYAINEDGSETKIGTAGYYNEKIR
jgi:hypothetical protein